MLKLSTKGRYATRVLVYLASRADDKPVPKHEIAKSEDITPDYLEQILIRLKDMGLVQSHRGKMGGFSLARDPSEITIQDVVEATEGVTCLVSCLAEGCTRASSCVTQEVWQKATDALRRVFSSFTVAELAAKAKHLRDSGSISYQI